MDLLGVAAVVPALISIVLGYWQARQSRKEVQDDIGQRVVAIEQAKEQAAHQDEQLANELKSIPESAPWVALARLTAQQHTGSAERLSQMSQSIFRQAGSLTVWAAVLNTVALVVVLASVTAALFGLVGPAAVSGLASAVVFAAGHLTNRQADAMNARADRNQVALEAQIFSQERFGLALSSAAGITNIEKRDEVIVHLLLAHISGPHLGPGPISPPPPPASPSTTALSEPETDCV